MRIVKRYENHKHYDVGTGAYVSMVKVGEMAATEEGGVKVVSDRTGKDLTLESLARSLYDHLRVRDRSRPDPIGPQAIVKLIRCVIRTKKGKK